MFVADAVATRDGKLEALSRWWQYMAYFDPLTSLVELVIPELQNRGLFREE